MKTYCCTALKCAKIAMLHNSKIWKQKIVVLQLDMGTKRCCTTVFYGDIALLYCSYIWHSCIIGWTILVALMLKDFCAKHKWDSGEKENSNSVKKKLVNIYVPTSMTLLSVQSHTCIKQYSAVFFYMYWWMCYDFFILSFCTFLEFQYL